MRYLDIKEKSYNNLITIQLQISIKFDNFVLTAVIKSIKSYLNIPVTKIKMFIFIIDDFFLPRWTRVAFTASTRHGRHRRG